MNPQKDRALYPKNNSARAVTPAQPAPAQPQQKPAEPKPQTDSQAPAGGQTSPAQQPVKPLQPQPNPVIPEQPTAPVTPPAPPPAQPQQPQQPPITMEDIKQAFADMRNQESQMIDQKVQQGVLDLEQAQKDAQAGFDIQRNRINVDEAQARDAHVLYARGRGDRGGITARQYDSIANTAAQARAALGVQQQKLATDNAREIARLRAQGEFDKADALLRSTQQELAQMLQYQQAQEQKALQEAQLTGKYNGEDTFAAKEAAKEWAYQNAMEQIKMGIMPDNDTLAQAGLNAEKVALMVYLYGQLTGNAGLLQQMGGGGGGFGGGGGHGGGGGRYGHMQRPDININIDYQDLINKAVEKGDYKKATQLQAMRNQKLDYISSIDHNVDYQGLINQAVANGDFVAAGQLNDMRDAKLEGQKYIDSLTGGSGRTANDYLPSNPKRTGGGGGGDKTWLESNGYIS